jgi:serine O-acetyltransferase
MHLTIAASDLARYLDRQIRFLFPDGARHSTRQVVDRALEVCEFRFSRVRLASYCDRIGPKFNHLNSDQYASFIYECSRVAFAEIGDLRLAEKLFFLNKALNSIVCMYDTRLPDVFLLIHTVGTVIGKATYGEELVVCHGVTVGTDRGNAPVLGSGVVLFGGATVLGASELGNDVSVAAGALLRNRSVPSAHVVAGRDPGLVVKPAKRRLRDTYFRSA